LNEGPELAEPVALGLKNDDRDRQGIDVLLKG
jgi:hypothetical protein